MATAALSCQELVELVTDYLEGALPPDEAARFESHISGCSGCTRYLAQMRKTIRLTGRLAEEHLTPDAKSALLDAFKSWKQSRD